MTLTELRYIVALANERHFGRAAEACFVSQPTLSVAIKKLEEELGVIMFERGSSEATVTPLGKRIVEQAQRALEQVMAIKEIAKQGKDPLVGPLRFGAIYTVGPYLLPQLIPRLNKLAPNMPLLIQESYTSRLVEIMKQGELDVIVIASPIDEPGITVQPVYDEPFVVAVPRGHPWEKRKTVASADLEKENMLLLGSGHCFRDQVLKVCPALNRAAVAPGAMQKTLEGSSLETIRHMVASGVGVTVLPCTSVSPGTGSGGLLRYCQFAKPVPDRRVALAWRSSFPRLQAIETLRQAILECKLGCVKKLNSSPV